MPAYDAEIGDVIFWVGNVSPRKVTRGVVLEIIEICGQKKAVVVLENGSKAKWDLSRPELRSQKEINRVKAKLNEIHEHNLAIRREQAARRRQIDRILRPMLERGDVDGIAKYIRGELNV